MAKNHKNGDKPAKLSLENLFSTWVTDDQLEVYRGQIKSSPHRFNMYISSTLKWEQQKEIGGDECPQGNQVSVKFGDGGISAFLICSDVTTLSLTVKNFPGSSLIFLNLPKDWEKSSIEKAFGNIKAITTRYYSTGYFRIVVFPHDPNPFGQLSLAVEIAKAFGMNCEVAYYTTTVIQIKRGRREAS
ncbi:unnamed protein product [Porites lobata]|uniref:Uncharacterized protein n=1 Tax=Porites lobata TaxID=104759 RepID=A0ABN8NGW0_9CNID|nr:unnamed protein product [Porites lobata]